MIIEISKEGIKSIQEGIKAGFYNEWTKDRIKGAFNFGNGTDKHFHEYIKNNRRFAWFYDVEKGVVI